MPNGAEKAYYKREAKPFARLNEPYFSLQTAKTETAMNNYLTVKKPLSAILLFSLPIIIGNLFQQTYTMADSAIVGRYVSEQALAAIGASYALTNIFICVADRKSVV